MSTGPQLLSWWDFYNNHWLYVQCWDFEDEQQVGVTDRCSDTWGCVRNDDIPLVTDYGVIWLDPVMDPYKAGATLSHEIGHFLGLRHHLQNGCGSLMEELYCGTYWPKAVDIGDTPACGSDPIRNGIRCVWTWLW